MNYLRQITVRAVEEKHHSPELAADFSGIDQTSIYDWLRNYRYGGEEALDTRKPPGALFISICKVKTPAFRPGLLISHQVAIIFNNFLTFDAKNIAPALIDSKLFWRIMLIAIFLNKERLLAASGFLMPEVIMVPEFRTAN